MDNLGAPKAERVRAALEAARIADRYLPSYPPDPWGAALPTLIEPCWSKLKGWLRVRAARTLAGLEAELGPAPATITAANAEGWSRLCGYVPPN